MRRFNGRLIGIVIGIVATCGLIGPYIMEMVFGLATAVPHNAKIVLGIVAIILEFVALFLAKKDNAFWKWVSFLAGTVFVCIALAATFQSWMAALMGMLWLKIVCIALLILSVVISYIVYQTDKKPAKKSPHAHEG